jgi:hypothetical protein
VRHLCVSSSRLWRGRRALWSLLILWPEQQVARLFNNADSRDALSSTVLPRGLGWRIERQHGKSIKGEVSGNARHDPMTHLTRALVLRVAAQLLRWVGNVRVAPSVNATPRGARFHTLMAETLTRWTP